MGLLTHYTYFKYSGNYFCMKQVWFINKLLENKLLKPYAVNVMGKSTCLREKKKNNYNLILFVLSRRKTFKVKCEHLITFK